MNRTQANLYRMRIEQAAASLSDQDALTAPEMFPHWKPGIHVEVPDRYCFDNALYRVVQSHDTLSGWEPDITPALWTRVSIEEFPEWVQPTGVQDSYPLDAKVSHNNKHWKSDYDNNVWEPGVYGWTEI